MATGEQCQNRIVFKQLMSSGGVHFVQIDSCRVAGVNEIILILLLAKKFNLPVCPHAGGVGIRGPTYFHIDYHRRLSLATRWWGTRPCMLF